MTESGSRRKIRIGTKFTIKGGRFLKDLEKKLIWKKNIAPRVMLHE